MRKLRSLQDWDLCSHLNAYSILDLKPDFTLGHIQQLNQFISTEQLLNSDPKQNLVADLNRLFWNFTVVASFPTFIGCHGDKIYWELIFSFPLHDQAEVIPCRCQLPFALFWVAWDASGQFAILFSPRSIWLRNIRRIVRYMGLCCWFENGKDKRKSRPRVEDRKKGNFI